MHASQPLRLRESQWTPPPEATDHAGGLLALDREFIAAPPVVIGPVLSAGSTVRKNQFIWPKWLRAGVGRGHVRRCRGWDRSRGALLGRRRGSVQHHPWDRHLRSTVHHLAVHMPDEVARALHLRW